MSIYILFVQLHDVHLKRFQVPRVDFTIYGYMCAVHEPTLYGCADVPF